MRNDFRRMRREFAAMYGRMTLGTWINAALIFAVGLGIMQVVR